MAVTVIPNNSTLDCGSGSSAQPVGSDPNNCYLGNARPSSGVLFTLRGASIRCRDPPPGRNPTHSGPAQAATSSHPNQGTLCAGAGYALLLVEPVEAVPGDVPPAGALDQRVLVAATAADRPAVVRACVDLGRVAGGRWRGRLRSRSRRASPRRRDPGGRRRPGSTVRRSPSCRRCRRTGGSRASPTRRRRPTGRPMPPDPAASSRRRKRRSAHGSRACPRSVP